VAKKLTDSTDRFFDMLRDPSTSHKVLFRVAVPAALKFHKVRQTAAEFFTEVGVSYSDSPLNDDQHRREPRPGEYIRDGGLVRWPDLEPMRLYDALRVALIRRMSAENPLWGADFITIISESNFRYRQRY
jgi:hypothetical protein